MRRIVLAAGGLADRNAEPKAPGWPLSGRHCRAGDPWSFAPGFRGAAVTFSICARERYRDDGTTETRFGVAVTTRLPAVGTLCPFASENGAVATQSRVNVDLGRRGVEYVDDGLAVDDALDALLNADEGRAERQLHGVDARATFELRDAEAGRIVAELEQEGIVETYLVTLEARPDGSEETHWTYLRESHEES